MVDTFLCDMDFLVHSGDIASYANDNLPYTIRENKYEVEKKRNRIDKTM